MTNAQFILSLCNLLVDVIAANKNELHDSFVKDLFLKFCSIFEPEQINVYVKDWESAQHEADLAEQQKFGT